MTSALDAPDSLKSLPVAARVPLTEMSLATNAGDVEVFASSEK